jgi:hypothetical protein
MHLELYSFHDEGSRLQALVWYCSTNSTIEQLKKMEFLEHTFRCSRNFFMEWSCTYLIEKHETELKKK